MGRPPAKDLTERELEVMHVFWRHGEATAAVARDRLAATGLDRTYTTIANLVRALHDKGFLNRSTTSGRSSTGRRSRTRTSPGGCWATWSTASSAARGPSCSAGWSSSGSSRPRSGPSSSRSSKEHGQ